MYPCITSRVWPTGTHVTPLWRLLSRRAGGVSRPQVHEPERGVPGLGQEHGLVPCRELGVQHRRQCGAGQRNHPRAYTNRCNDDWDRQLPLAIYAIIAASALAHTLFDRLPLSVQARISRPRSTLDGGASWS